MISRLRADGSSTWRQMRSTPRSTSRATAAGSTYDQAVRSAQAIDCEMLANGRDENMVCNSNPPAKVTQVK